ncbi:MAG: transposase [Nitrosomonas sp.]|nr:transposase [Nitrosomonas sp.]MDP1786318.1 transposase [Nitrosomonas sp.]
MKRSEAQTGAITLIQRFGSAGNLNIHLHCLVLDGVYRIQNGVAEFHSARSPTAEQLQSLLSQIIKRIMKALTRNGALIEEEGMSYLAEMETDAALAPLQSAACTYRIALGRRAGQKVLTLITAPTQNVQPQPDKKYCVNAHGFSLHAGVHCAMNQRKELEHLCRYITRQAIANERLTRNKDGQIVLKLKTPYRDGTTHIIMSPLEFMQRLAALVPRPRLNLIRFHGVLAPNAKLRAEIIPDGKKSKPSDANDDAPHSAASVRISWARLLKRVFDIDIEQCPHCGGALKIIAAILERAAITKILDHLGLPARAPPRAPAQIFDPFEPT